MARKTGFVRTALRGLAAGGLLLAAMVATPQPAEAAQGSIPFTVRSLGSAQASAPVFTGIPFPPGVAFDASQLELVFNGQSVARQVKTLSTYPDGSLRVVLMGTTVTVGAGQTLQAEIRFGSGRGQDLSPELPWSRTQNVLAMCAPEWYGASTVFNGRFFASSENTVLPAFETRMLDKYTRTSDPVSNTSPDYRNYYDHVHALYMTLLRSGGTSSMPARIWEEVQQYRENEILHSGTYKGQYHAGSRTTNTYPMWPEQVRRLYVQGLLEDYYFTGDARSLEVALEMAEVYVKDAYLGTERFSLSERLPAFEIFGLCAAYEQTLDARYLNAAKAIAEFNLAHQKAMGAKYPNQGGVSGNTGAFVHDKNGRWDDPEESSASGCGSPWMTGLLSEALLRLYWLTGDGRYRDSVVWAANWAVNAALVAANNPANRTGVDAFWYICKASDNSQIYPALNPMDFAMLGFAYQATGDEKYRQMGLRLAAANAWGNTIKEFNQGLHSGCQGLYFLQRGAGSVPLTLAEMMGTVPQVTPPTTTPAVQPTPAPAPAPTGDVVLYDDNATTGWNASSYRAALAASTSPVLTGSQSLGLTVTGVDGAVLLSGSGVPVSGQAYLKFSVHGGTRGGQQLRIRSVVDGRQQSNSLNLSSYGRIAANGWTHFAIPLSDLKATSGNLTGVKLFAGKRQSQVFVDHVRLSAS